MHTYEKYAGLSVSTPPHKASFYEVINRFEHRVLLLLDRLP